jgi:hypothetical protein
MEEEEERGKKEEEEESMPERRSVLPEPLPGLEDPEDARLARGLWQGEQCLSAESRGALLSSSSPRQLSVLTLRALLAQGHAVSQAGQVRVRGIMWRTMVKLLQDLIAFETANRKSYAEQIIKWWPDAPDVVDAFGEVSEEGFDGMRTQIYLQLTSGQVINPSTGQRYFYNGTIEAVGPEAYADEATLLADLPRLARFLSSTGLLQSLPADSDLARLINCVAGIDVLRAALDVLVRPAPEGSIATRAVRSTAVTGAVSRRNVSVDSPAVQVLLQQYAEVHLFAKLEAARRNHDEDEAAVREGWRDLFLGAVRVYNQLVLSGYLPPADTRWTQSLSLFSSVVVVFLTRGCPRTSLDVGVSQFTRLVNEYCRPDKHPLADDMELLGKDEEDTLVFMKNVTRILLDVTQLKPLQLLRASWMSIARVQSAWPLVHIMVTLLTQSIMQGGKYDLSAIAHAGMDTTLEELAMRGYTPAWVDTELIMGPLTSPASVFENINAEVRFVRSSTLHMLMELAPFRLLLAVTRMPRNALVRVAVTAHINKPVTMDGTGNFPLHLLIESENAWLHGSQELGTAGSLEAGQAVGKTLVSAVALGADVRAKNAAGRDVFATLIEFIRVRFCGVVPRGIGYDWDEENVPHGARSFPKSNDNVYYALASATQMLTFLASVGADVMQEEPPPPGSTPRTSHHGTPLSAVGVTPVTPIAPISTTPHVSELFETEEEEAQEPPQSRRRIVFSGIVQREGKEEEEEEEEKVMEVSELMEFASPFPLPESGAARPRRLIEGLIEDLAASIAEMEQDALNTGHYNPILEAYQGMLKQLMELVSQSTRKRGRVTPGKAKAALALALAAAASPSLDLSKAAFVRARAEADAKMVRRARRAEARAQQHEELARAVASLQISNPPGPRAALPFSFV